MRSWRRLHLHPLQKKLLPSNEFLDFEIKKGCASYRSAPFYLLDRLQYLISEVCRLR